MDSLDKASWNRARSASEGCYYPPLALGVRRSGAESRMIDMDRILDRESPCPGMRGQRVLRRNCDGDQETSRDPARGNDVKERNP